jgi:hypothetical protein
VIIVNNGKINLHLVLFYTTKVLWICFVLAALFFIWTVFAKKEDVEPLSVTSIPAQQIYSTIGSGPLSLSRGEEFIYLSVLSHQIEFKLQNSRPDALEAPANLKMTLKGGVEEKVIESGEKIYLAGSLDKGPFCFSEEPSSIWIVPRLSHRGAVLVEVGILKPSGEMMLQFTSDPFINPSGDILTENYFHHLSQARWWGEDLLFQKYGGKDFEASKSKQKIVFAGPDPYFLFVDVGDLLLWENNRWRVITSEEASPDLPIAQIKSIQNQELEIETWGQAGGTPELIRLVQERIPPMPLRMEGLPSSLRLRSSTQVTCLFGKRRMILRQGDWLLKTNAGWHVLKNLKDFDDYINHKTKGDLFVFDSIEKDGDNLKLLGSLFNGSRTQVHPISLPIEKDNKRIVPRVKKKRVISKRI